MMCLFYTRTHTHTHTHTHTRAHIHIHTYTRTRTRTHSHTHTRRLSEWLTKEETEAMMHEGDFDSSDDIDYQEFAEVLAFKRDAQPPHQEQRGMHDLNVHLKRAGLSPVLDLRARQISLWRKAQCAREAKIKYNKFYDSCRGYVELAFSSATPDKHVAFTYSDALKCKGEDCDGWSEDERMCNKHLPTVLEINTGQVA